MDQQQALLAAALAQQAQPLQTTVSTTSPHIISPTSEQFSSLGRNTGSGQSLADAIAHAANTAVAMDSLSRSANAMAQDQVTLAAALMAAAGNTQTQPPQPNVSTTTIQEQIQNLHLQQALQNALQQNALQQNALQQNALQQQLMDPSTEKLQDSTSPGGASKPIAVAVPPDQSPSESVGAALVAIAQISHAHAQAQQDAAVMQHLTNGELTSPDHVAPTKHSPSTAVALGNIQIPPNPLQTTSPLTNPLLASLTSTGLGTPGGLSSGASLGTPSSVSTSVDPILVAVQQAQQKVAVHQAQVAVAQQAAVQQALEAVQQQAAVQQVAQQAVQAIPVQPTVQQVLEHAVAQQAVQHQAAQAAAVQQALEQAVVAQQQQAVHQAIQQVAAQQALSANSSPPIQSVIPQPEKGVSQMIVDHITPAVQQMVQQVVTDAVSAALQPVDANVAAIAALTQPQGHRRTGSIPQAIAAANLINSVIAPPATATFAPALPNIPSMTAEPVSMNTEAPSTVTRASKRIQNQRKSSTASGHADEDDDLTRALEIEEAKIVQAGLLSGDMVLEGANLETVVNSLYAIMKRKLYTVAGYSAQGEYARGRWNLSPERYSQLLACAPILQALQKFEVRPENEKTYRAIGYYCKREKDWPKVWSKVLEMAVANAQHISSTFVVQVMSTLEFITPAIEYSPPEDVVAEVEGFLGGISLDPVWHPATTVRASHCFGRLPDGSYVDACDLKCSWKLQNQSPTTVFQHFYADTDNARISVFNNKLLAEYEMGNVSEALTMFKLDWNDEAHRDLLKTRPWVLLTNVKFIPTEYDTEESKPTTFKEHPVHVEPLKGMVPKIVEEPTPTGKRKRKPKVPQVENCSYVLVYIGRRHHEFYRRFETKAMVPGLNAMAVTQPNGATPSSPTKSPAKGFDFNSPPSMTQPATSYNQLFSPHPLFPENHHDDAMEDVLEK